MSECVSVSERECESEYECEGSDQGQSAPHMHTDLAQMPGWPNTSKKFTANTPLESVALGTRSATSSVPVGASHGAIAASAQRLPGPSNGNTRTVWSECVS